MCCDRKSRAACAQSFALWQQATIEIMRRNLSSRTLVIMFNRSHVNISRATTSQSLLLLLACATYIMVLFFTHIPFVVIHTINATPPERLQHMQWILGGRLLLEARSSLNNSLQRTGTRTLINESTQVRFFAAEQHVLYLSAAMFCT